MILSPGVEEQLPVFFYNGDRPTNVSVGHPTLRNDGQIDDVDPCFAFSDNMDMRRFVVGSVDDEAHSMLAKKRDHKITQQLRYFKRAEMI
jgi:hypothetical protein